MPKMIPPQDDAPGGGAAGVGSRLVNHAISARTAAAEVMAAHAKRHGDYPVSKVLLYRRDAIVRKVNPDIRQVTEGFGGRPAGAVISEFSQRSRYQLLHFMKNCDADFRSMMTLTYPREFPADGRIVKAHLRALKERLRRRWVDFRAIWFLEFQRRGAPHYHVMCEWDLASYGDPVLKRRWRGKRKDASYWTVPLLEEWLALSWYEIVGSGDERHLRAGVSWEIVETTDGALRYGAAHAAKPNQKQVPLLYQNVGRFWGKIGELRCVKIGETTIDSAGVFDAYGHDALSTKGRIRKFLWDGSNKFAADEGSM